MRTFFAASVRIRYQPNLIDAGAVRARHHLHDAAIRHISIGSDIHLAITLRAILKDGCQFLADDFRLNLVARTKKYTALTIDRNNNLFSITSQSGPALLGTALSGSRGSIQQGTLEASNVDPALELTRLIIAQRAFQVNARTITVSNDVLQELATIIR